MSAVEQQLAHPDRQFEIAFALGGLAQQGFFLFVHLDLKHGALRPFVHRKRIALELIWY